MRMPATALSSNLMFTRTGTVWASYRLQPLAYGYCPTDIKKSVKAFHQQLFQAFEGEAVVSGLTADVDPVSVVEQMLEGVDATQCPVWVNEVLLTLDSLEEMQLGTRAFWLSVPLKMTAVESLKATGKSFQREFAERLALPRIVPTEKEISAFQAKADAFERMLPAVFKARKASAAEHVWMSVHHQQRGLAADGHVPSVTATGDVSEEVVQLGSTIPEPWIDEGGQSDQRRGKILQPLAHKYLKVGSGSTPSYQVLQAVTATPKAGMLFPGTEWLYLADTLSVDVDWVLRLTVTAADLAKKQNARAESTLADQYFQRTDEGITGSNAELDEYASHLAAFQKALNRSERETKVQMTAIFAVGGRTSEEAKETAEELSAFYRGMELILQAPLGMQEELWWAMQVGVPTSKQVREFAHLTTARDLAGAIPFASTALGATKGSLLGMNVSTNRQTPVLIDIEGSILGNKSGSSATVAEQGAGKTFLQMKMAGDVIDRGGRLVALDHSDTKEWAQFAKSVIDSVEVDVLDPAYSLDTLRIFGIEDGAPMVETLFTTLMNIAPTDDEGILLSEVLDHEYLTDHQISSLSEILDHLNHHCELEGAAALAKRMNAFARKKLGKVLFDPSIPAMPLGSRAIVFCTHGLGLPTPDEVSSAHLFRQLSVEKIFGRSLYALLARIGHFICFKDRSELAIFNADEAYHLTNSNEGNQVIELFVREGRRARAAINLGSHDGLQDFGNEVVRGLITTRFVMRQTDRDLAIRALKWIGLDHTDESLIDLVMTDLSPIDENTNKVVRGREGEAIFRDASQRFGRIQITRPAANERYAALITTPITEAERQAKALENQGDRS